MSLCNVSQLIEKVKHIFIHISVKKAYQQRTLVAYGSFLTHQLITANHCPSKFYSTKTQEHTYNSKQVKQMTIPSVLEETQHNINLEQQEIEDNEQLGVI